MRFAYTAQWAKSPGKNSLKECALLIRHSKIQCHVVKNTLLQTAFSAIFFVF